MCWKNLTEAVRREAVVVRVTYPVEAEAAALFELVGPLGIDDEVDTPDRAVDVGVEDTNELLDTGMALGPLEAVELIVVDSNDDDGDTDSPEALVVNVTTLVVVFVDVYLEKDLRGRVCRGCLVVLIVGGVVIGKGSKGNVKRAPLGPPGRPSC